MANSDGSVLIEIDGDESKFKGKLDSLGGIASSAMKGVTMAVGAASAAMGAMGAAAVKFGSDFEQTMANTSTMFGDVAVDTKGLNDQILALSNATGLAADDIGKSLYNALSAGIPVTEDMGDAMAYMEANVKLAKAGFTDVDTAVTATAKVLNAYKMDVSEVDKVHKVLMQTQNKGITTVGELGASLAQVTPTAAAMSVSFEQVGASLATMTAQGTPTAQATTQLNSLLAELGKSGTQAQKGLAEALKGTEYAGKSFQALMKAGVPLNTVLDLMDTQAQKGGKSLLDMFGSIEAGKAALAMSGQNAQQFTANLAAMGTEADVVGSAYEKATDTLQARLGMLKESFKNLGIAVYMDGVGPLKEFAGAALDMVGEITDAFESGGLEGAVGALGGVFARLAGMAVEAAPGVIDAGVQMVSSFLDGLEGGAVQIASGAAEMIAKLAEGIVACLPQFYLTALKLIKVFMAGIANALPELLTTTAGAVVTLAQGLVEAAPQMVATGLYLVQRLVQGVLEAIPVLLEGLPALVAAYVGYLRESVPKVIETGVDIFTSLVGALPEIISGIVAVLPELIDGVLSALLDNLPMIAEAGVDLLTALVEDLPTIISAVTDALPELISGVIDALMDNLPLLIDTGVDLLVALVENLPAIIAGIAQAIPQLVQGVADAIVGNIDKIILAGVQLFVALVTNLPAIIGGIVKAVPQIVAGIVNAFGSLMGTMGDIGLDLVKGIAKGITGAAGWLMDQVKGFFGGVVDGVKDFLGIHSPSRVFAQIGEFTIQGMGVGMKNGGGKVIKTAQQLSEAVYNAASGWVKDKRAVDDLAAADEAAFWEELKTVGGLGAEELKAIDQNLYKARANASKEAYEASKGWIDEEVFYNRLSADQVVEAWQRVVDRGNLQADEQKKAQKELYRARESAAKEAAQAVVNASKSAYQGSKKWIDNEKFYHRLSAKEEVEAWERVVERHNLGADEQMEAEKALYTARQNLLKEQTEAEKKVYYQQKKAYDEYQKTVESRRASLEGFAGLFDGIEKKADVSGRKLLKNLKDQVKTFQDWQGDMAKLQERGITGPLLDELSELGPKAAAEIRALAQLSDKQLQEYADLFAEKSRLASEQAQSEVPPVALPVEPLSEAGKETLSGTANEAVDLLVETVEERQDDFRETGAQAMAGLNQGLAEQGRQAVDTARRIADSIIFEMRRALDIHSPSRKMAKLVGIPTAQGFLAGFQGEMEGLHRKMRAAVDLETGKIGTNVAAQAQGQAAAQVVRETRTEKHTVERVARLEGDGITGELVRMLGLRLKAEERRVGERLG